MSIAAELGRFASEFPVGDVPPKTMEYAAMLISSTVASAALGSTQESSRLVRSLEMERGGASQATAWFHGGPKLPIAAAARINALMSDAAASDDSDLRNIVHPGTTLAATSLAVGEKTGATGEEVLAAIVLGFDVASRINGAVIPGLREKGFHGCVIAAFGGAVAAARLMKLDAARLTQAIALIATSMGGIMAAANTSTAREWHAGLAAMLAVNAAQAAAIGYTAEAEIFEHDRGFLYVFGQQPDAGKVQAVTAGLGDRWEILHEMAIKLVPGGHPYHAIAEAAAKASRENEIRPEDVEAILISQVGVRRLSGPRHPSDLIGVAHSPRYFAAAGIVDRDFSWAHATDAKINDPAIRSLFDKVEIGPQPTEEVERYKQGATVTVRLRGGRSVAGTVFAPRGSASRGVEWPDVEAKYRALLPFAGLPEQAIKQSADVIRSFRVVRNLSEFLGLLK